MIYVSIANKNDFAMEVNGYKGICLNSEAIYDYIESQKTFVYVKYDEILDEDIYIIHLQQLYLAMQDIKYLKDSDEVIAESLYYYEIDDQGSLLRFLGSLLVDKNYDWDEYVIVCKLETRNLFDITF